jgi:membrane-associated phospholipid phosphatase
MSEIVALVGKFISNPPFILCILLLGYLGGDRSKFARVITSVLFATILTSLLKSIFKVPLPPGNNEGWSFPSGHTITNIVLWFSISIEYRNKIISLLSKPIAKVFLSGLTAMHVVLIGVFYI